MVFHVSPKHKLDDRHADVLGRDDAHLLHLDLVFGQGSETCKNAWVMVSWTRRTWTHDFMNHYAQISTVISTADTFLHILAGQTLSSLKTM